MAYNGNMAVKETQPTDNPGLRLYRPKTLAERWDMSLSTIYKLISAGELEATRVGRSVRISDAQAKRFLERAGILEAA